MSSLPPPLPLSDWPLADQLAWKRATTNDPLAPGGGGGGTAWRPVTLRHNEKGYGRWLAWLSANGVLTQVPEGGPASRATLERVRAYLTAVEHAGLADYSRAGRLQTLGDALRVMEPLVDTHFIGRAAGRISASARRKNDPRSKMKPAVDILAFGEELMNLGEDCATGAGLKDALAYRDGLLLSVWVLRALRIANLSQISIAHQLVEDEDGKRRLIFSAEEMKANRPFECDWPSALEENLTRYLTYYRPTLLTLDDTGSDDKRLWISKFGKGMGPGSVAQIINLRTAKKFGCAMPSHLPRYIAATEIARHRPSFTSDAAAMLGHASLQTSEQHYRLASGAAAIEAYQSAITRGLQR